MITILVVDDHPIVRQGVVSALEDEADFNVVGALTTAEEALKFVVRTSPAVILLDLELPGISGIAALPRLLAASPTSQILVFTAYETDERVFGAIQAGAKGYLLKGAPIEEITRAIRTVHAGGSHLEPRVAARVLAELHTPRRTSETLSDREQEVLQLVAEGLSNKEIGRALSISERTSRFHVTSILNKLGASTRAQAVAIASQRGFLTTDQAQ